MVNAAYEHKAKPITLKREPILSSIPHFHKEIEIVYTKNGSCTARADRQSYYLKSGDLFITFPNQIHYYENSLLGEYYVIIVNQNIFFELNNVFSNFLPVNNIIELKNRTFSPDLLDDIYYANGEFKNTIIVGLLNQFIGQLLPRIELQQRIQTENSTLQSILNFCSNNYTQNISLEHISNELHLNKYHISHLLSGKFGISFNSYINMLRINLACTLLENTDKKVSTISEEVGFGSICSFNRSFLEITKTTPLKYRATYRNKN